MAASGRASSRRPSERRSCRVLASAFSYGNGRALSRLSNEAQRADILRRDEDISRRGIRRRSSPVRATQPSRENEQTIGVVAPASRYFHGVNGPAL